MMQKTVSRAIGRFFLYVLSSNFTRVAAPVEKDFKGGSLAIGSGITIVDRLCE